MTKPGARRNPVTRRIPFSDADVHRTRAVARRSVFRRVVGYRDRLGPTCGRECHPSGDVSDALARVRLDIDLFRGARQRLPGPADRAGGGGLDHRDVIQCHDQSAGPVRRQFPADRHGSAELRPAVRAARTIRSLGCVRARSTGTPQQSGRRQVSCHGLLHWRAICAQADRAGTGRVAEAVLQQPVGITDGNRPLYEQMWRSWGVRLASRPDLSPGGKSRSSA
jgi:hypothetical protein